jgi:hypothetical protein
MTRKIPRRIFSQLQGDIGGFTPGWFEKIPPHPPFAKGGKLFTDKL